MEWLILLIKYFLHQFFHVEFSGIPIDKATATPNYISKNHEYIEQLHSLLSNTLGDYVLKYLVMKQQLNILISTSIPLTSTPSTSIQDILKLPEPIKHKINRQYKKINY